MIDSEGANHPYFYNMKQDTFHRVYGEDGKLLRVYKNKRLILK